MLDREGPPEEVASVLGRYGTFLSQDVGDHERAWRYYEESLQLAGHEPNIMANAAQVLFVLGRDEEAIGLLGPLLAQSVSPIVRLEAEFYWFAHVERGPGRSLAVLKRLLLEDVRSVDWSLRWNVEKAIRDGHRTPDLLERLSHVISGRESVELLDSYHEWRDVQ